MQGALSGLKVLDLSRLLPGPFCSMLMADLGADVIKVEDPRMGDYIRWWPPKIGGNSGFHIVLNRNKRSLTLNLKNPEAKVIFEKLAADADVVLEGFRPGVMAKLGLDFKSLDRINPRLVYCAISGYGAEGALAYKAGHDVNYLGLERGPFLQRQRLADNDRCPDSGPGRRRSSGCFRGYGRAFCA